MDHNPYETAHIPRAVIDRAAGQACGLAEADCYVHANGAPSWPLIKALRLCSLPRSEHKRLGYKAAAGQPCSPISEKEVRTGLIFILINPDVHTSPCEHALLRATFQWCGQTSTQLAGVVPILKGCRNCLAACSDGKRRSSPEQLFSSLKGLRRIKAQVVSYFLRPSVRRR